MLETDVEEGATSTQVHSHEPFLNGATPGLPVPCSN
jgi:hypothetical protein